MRAPAGQGFDDAFCIELRECMLRGSHSLP